MEDARLAELRTALLGWFDRNRRELPWRYAPGETPDPYRVWLSEIMLQQTRVETVRPYFERWVERFPSLSELADAELDDVLKGWEGLGYYSRARNFHRAVREVVDRYCGAVPDDPVEFRSLPGVGAYTAGAVMSIAFGRPEPIVDGNVRRVFARLLDSGEPPRRTLWKLASRLVEGERPGDLNQSMMELGALVCTPRAPRCEICPVSDHCAAHAAGTQAFRPDRRTRAAIPTEWHGVAVVRRDSSFLVVRRPVEGRLGGLWEFPGCLRREGEGAREAARRAALEQTGVEVHIEDSIARIEHVFTHVRVVYDAYFAIPSSESTTTGLEESGPNASWSTLPRLGDLALPTAQRKIVNLLAAPESAVVAIIEDEAPLDLGE